MRNTMQKLFIMFVLSGLCLVISLQGFSQTAEKSEHPLLDKYYPQKAPDTTKAVTTQTHPAPELRPVTPAIKPVTPTTIVTEEKPSAQTTPVYSPTPASLVADTTAVHKQTQNIVPVPAQPRLQPKPAATPTRDSRLGSSSPLYDTYEKNSNGAGSVTTNPK